MTDLETVKEDGDPLLPLDRCCDLNEILIISAINRKRAIEDAEREAKSKSRRRR